MSEVARRPRVHVDVMVRDVCAEDMRALAACLRTAAELAGINGATLIPEERRLFWRRVSSSLRGEAAVLEASAAEVDPERGGVS